MTAASGNPHDQERAKVARRRRGPKKDPRQELLNRTIDYVGKYGIAELSLRQLASAIGTSHRMLSYHFDSKEDLLAAVVHAVEAQIGETLLALDARHSLSPDEEIRQIWDHITQPVMLSYGRLYVEMFGQALRGRAPAMFDDLDRYWIEALMRVSVSAGRTADVARVEGRLALGVLRGLYLDLLANGDHRGVKQAWDMFLTRYAEPAAAPRKARGSAGGAKAARGQARSA